jgi:hypothetical protein
MHISEFPPEADATPVTVINASAKPIFRITLKSSNSERGESNENTIDTVSDWQQGIPESRVDKRFAKQYVKSSGRQGLP